MGTFSGIFTTPPYFGSQCYSFGLGLFRREDPWRCHFRQMLLRWSLVVLALVECTGLQLGSRFGRKCAASLASLSLLWPASVVPLLSPAPVFAKDLPALEKCFNAVRKELDMKYGGESLKRLEHDINEADWAAIEDTIYLNACPNHRPHPENEWQNRDTRHGSDASGQPVTLNPTLNLTMIMITTNKESIHPNPTLKYPDGH